MQARQRVALVTSSFHPRIGGVEQHVRRVASALTAQGYEAQVWTVALGDPPIEELDGVPVVRLPCPLPRQSLAGVTEFVAALPSAVREWRAAWRSLRPDVVHVHCFGPNGPWAMLAATLGQRPLVLSAHGETFADPSVFAGSVLLRSTLRRALRRASHVTGCSAAVLDDLRARYGLSGGSVVYGGVDPATGGVPSIPNLPDGGRYVLGVGRVVDLKGFDVLAAAASDLPPDCWAVIAGDGPGRAALAESAKSSRVLFLGSVAPEKVSALMAGAAAVVVPSRREAFGLVVLEAWSAGTPVVASAVDGLGALVRHGVDGVLVPPDDANALARALRLLLADDAGARGLAEAGRRRARHLTWSETATAYSRIYERVTGASSLELKRRARGGKTAAT